MKNLLGIVVILVFLAAMVSIAFTYTVRYTEAAVETTFGKAGENGVKKDPGLYFRWPYPIQSVTTYDTRVRVMTLKLETQQTADNRQVVVEGFCTWHVEDPLKFFQSFSNAGQRSDEHYRNAEDNAIRTSLRSALALVSKYRLDELFTTSTDSKLAELEGAMIGAMQSSAQTGAGALTSSKLADYGITVTDVGISRIALPEETTKAVFQRMKTSRERIAQETDSRGTSQAQQIRSKAESDSKRIKDFADRLAQDIRSRGDQEAVPYLAAMKENPELAVFLETMDFFRTSYGKRTTLVLSGSMPGVSLLFPNSIDGLKAGELPKIAAPDRNWLSDSMRRGPDADPSLKPNATGSTVNNGREGSR